MRLVLCAVLTLAALGTSRASASHQMGDGCNDDRGYLVCRPGARPGVPYYGNRYDRHRRGYHGRGYYDGRRFYLQRNLRRHYQDWRW